MIFLCRVNATQVTLLRIVQLAQLKILLRAARSLIVDLPSCVSRTTLLQRRMTWHEQPSPVEADLSQTSDRPANDRSLLPCQSASVPPRYRRAAAALCARQPSGRVDSKVAPALLQLHARSNCHCHSFHINRIAHFSPLAIASASHPFRSSVQHSLLRNNARNNIVLDTTVHLLWDCLHILHLYHLVTRRLLPASLDFRTNSRMTFRNRDLEENLGARYFFPQCSCRLLMIRKITEAFLSHVHVLPRQCVFPPAARGHDAGALSPNEALQLLSTQRVCQSDELAGELMSQTKTKYLASFSSSPGARNAHGIGPSRLALPLDFHSA